MSALAKAGPDYVPRGGPLKVTVQRERETKTNVVVNRGEFGININPYSANVENMVSS
jgi:hypothetical protein